jgi:hypothetical protein
MACNQPEGKKAAQSSKKNAPIADTELVKALVGTWESISLQITMPSWNGSDSTGYVTADESNWETIMQLKPVTTVFNSDHTYYAEYYDLNGQLVNRPSGTWEIRGNTLTYKEEVPVPMTFFQQVEKINETDYRFIFQMDYDQDGREDDQGVGISRKIN